MRKAILLVLLAIPLVICGCGKAPTSASAWKPAQPLQIKVPTPLGPSRPYNATISVSQTEIPLTEGIEQVWIYLPTPLPTGKLPCVLIAPAGSHLIDGMVLGDGDRE